MRSRRGKPPLTGGLETGGVEQREVVQVVGTDLSSLPHHAVLVGGNELGRDQRTQDAFHVALASASKSPVRITQRMRCWISVFGTEALTL